MGKDPCVGAFYHAPLPTWEVEERFSDSGGAVLVYVTATRGRFCRCSSFDFGVTNRKRLSD